MDNQGHLGTAEKGAEAAPRSAAARPFVSCKRFAAALRDLQWLVAIYTMSMKPSLLRRPLCWSLPCSAAPTSWTSAFAFLYQ